MNNQFMTDKVILVDEHDNVVGNMEKMEAHLLGKLHRAFSIFIFNTNGDLLLQQRALSKYHSGGKWTNTCCSHPRPGEKTIDAAHRRLVEEMGFDCALFHTFHFTYQAAVEKGLTEYEYDHVYFGVSDIEPVPNPEEVDAAKYISIDQLEEELNANSTSYTQWLNICFAQVKHHHHQLFKQDLA